MTLHVEKIYKGATENNIDFLFENRKYERVLKNLLALKDKEHLLIERDSENVQKVKEMDEALEKFKENAKRHVAG